MHFSIPEQKVGGPVMCVHVAPSLNGNGRFDNTASHRKDRRHPKRHCHVNADHKVILSLRLSYGLTHNISFKCINFT